MSHLLEANETKELLKEAEALIASGKYFAALVAIRKAIFIEFEAEYSVYGWRDYEGQDEVFGLGSLARGGWKAHYWTRTKDWIAKNVKDPIGYIQIDYDRWRLDATEWGINTAELENIRNLTPAVFRPDKQGEWCIKHKAGFPTTGATPANAKYCLDRAIAVVLKKQEHLRAAKYSPVREAAKLPD